MEVFDLTCPDCGDALRLAEGLDGRPYYRCMSWPKCRGSHCAHWTGKPLGIPADRDTKSMRMAAHTAFDELWKKGVFPSRGHAYGWMQDALGMSPEEAHIANFDAPTCSRLIRAVWDVQEELERHEERRARRGRGRGSGEDGGGPPCDGRQERGVDSVQAR